MTDYGRDTVYTPAPEPQTDARAARTTYRTEAHDLTIVLEDEPCRDAMSAEAFPTTVQVTLDGVSGEWETARLRGVRLTLGP